MGVDPSKIDDAYEYGMLIFSRWFFGSIAFAVLPVGVVLVLSYLLNGSTGNPLLLPELGFASVVILGATSSQFVDFKTRLQGDQSYKVVAGTRFLVLSLVFAVLFLALVYMEREGIRLNSQVLAFGQLTLFIIALLFSGINVWAREQLLRDKARLPKTLSKIRYFSHINASFEVAERELNHMQYALSRWTSITPDVPEGYYNTESYNRTLAQDTRDRLFRLSEKLRTVSILAENGLLRDLDGKSVEQAASADRPPDRAPSEGR